MWNAKSLIQDLNSGRRIHLLRLTAITQECCEQYWISHGGSTPQRSGCTATYHPSRKLSKLDKPDMRDTAGEVGTNSKVTYTCGPLHMDDQAEPTYNRSVPIQDVALKTDRKRLTIEKGGGRESARSVLMARHDDDDDPQTICIS